MSRAYCVFQKPALPTFLTHRLFGKLEAPLTHRLFGKLEAPDSEGGSEACVERCETQQQLSEHSVQSIWFPVA